VTVLDLRDLLKLQKLLQDWQPKLVAYTELLAQKQEWRQKKDQQLAQQSLSQKEVDLQQQRDLLITRLNAIKANEDYMALADEKTRKTYLAIERSEATIAKLKARGEDTSEYDERLKTFRGILQWRASQAFPANLWASESSANELDKSLASIKASREKIGLVSATAVDLQPLLARIQQQQTQVEEQLLGVNREIESRAAQLRVQVDKQLEGHEKRLNRYLAQSNLAVARLYDTALRKQGQ
jgi:hypothetical protein